MPGSDWVWRFHRDYSAWVRDPKVFLDRGRLLPGEEPLLKERRSYARTQQNSCGVLFRHRGGNL